MINAAHHANEWQTSLIIMLFVEEYLQKHEKKEKYKEYNTERLWDDVSLFIVPMVNPDGVNLCLKKQKTLKQERYQNIWKPYEKELEKWKANIRGESLINFHHIFC